MMVKIVRYCIIVASFLSFIFLILSIINGSNNYETQVLTNIAWFVNKILLPIIVLIAILLFVFGYPDFLKEKNRK